MDMDRIYQGQDAHWYFNVRGNQQMGPFATHFDAEQALTKHVDACTRRLHFGSLLPDVLSPLRARRREPQPRHT